jgi:CheY-like chemotaxis protein
MISQVPLKYVLYAEDDTDDQEILTSLIPEADPELEVISVNNGLEVIQFLDSLPSHSTSPCLVILDVNMPLWDGIHTLRALKGSQKYNHLPVVMFSTSNDRKDIELALRLGALHFFTKPVHQHDIAKIVKQFADFCQPDHMQTKN